MDLSFDNMVGSIAFIGLTVSMVYKIANIGVTNIKVFAVVA